MKRFAVGTGWMVLAVGLFLSPAHVMAADVSGRSAVRGTADRPAPGTSRSGAVSVDRIWQASPELRHMNDGTPLRDTMNTNWKKYEPVEGQQPRSAHP